MSRRVRRLACLLVAAQFLMLPVASAQGTVPTLPTGEQPCIRAPERTSPEVPWAQRLLAPQRVWDLTRGAGITVAVVDTGVDAGTPQLAAGEVLPGANVIEGQGGPANDDCFGHGTFVAGIIAAKPTAGAGFTGVAPDVRILPVRVATGMEESEGGFSPSALARGIRKAVDMGAEVINVSASTSAPNNELASAVEYAEQQDALIVASAANGAEKGDPVTYPASYPSVIAVGAIDSVGSHADFSQTGPYLSLVAPGVDVLSIGPHGPGHWQGSGTSYAAPFVSGVAALVRAHRPELNAAQVKQRLELTASHPAAELPDPAMGWGTVNPMAAVSSAVPGEGGSGKTVVPPAPKPVKPAPVDQLGPALAILAAVGAAVSTLLLVLVFRLGAAGQRRRWGPARVVVPTTPDAKTNGAE